MFAVAARCSFFTICKCNQLYKYKSPIGFFIFLCACFSPRAQSQLSRLILFNKISRYFPARVALIIRHQPPRQITPKISSIFYAYFSAFLLPFDLVFLVLQSLGFILGLWLWFVCLSFEFLLANKFPFPVRVGRKNSNERKWWRINIRLQLEKEMR